MIYQDPYESLDPRFTVRDTVEEPLLVHRHRPRQGASARPRYSDALERAGLTPPELFIDRFPHELSGGQRQRVAIAASLVLDPKLLVADEPVSMLDVSVRAGILSLLDGLRKDGMGILMITHDLSTAAHFADRIAVMYLGRIVEEGPAREVVRNPQHPYTRALITVVPKRDPREQTTPQILTGETPNPIHVPSGCRFHPRCPDRRGQLLDDRSQPSAAAGRPDARPPRRVHRHRAGAVRRRGRAGRRRRAARVSAADLTRDALARIEATEPALNAFVTVTADLALKQAAAADAGTAGGPLAGIPVAIKDLVDVAGVPTSMGSLVHQGRVAGRRFAARRPDPGRGAR